MVATGDKSAATLKRQRRGSGGVTSQSESVHHAPEGDTAAARLMRMMMALDEAAARTLICDAHRGALSAQGSGPPRGFMGCDPRSVQTVDAPTDTASIVPSDQPGPEEAPVNESAVADVPAGAPDRRRRTFALSARRSSSRFYSSAPWQPRRSLAITGAVSYPNLLWLPVAVINATERAWAPLCSRDYR